MNILDTITNNTNVHISELLSTIVLPQLAAYVNEKFNADEEMQVTVPEFENVLLLNQAKFEPVNNKKRKKHVLNKEGRQCAWEFKRGGLKGTNCTKIAIEGSEYCPNCSKREVIVATQKNNKNVPKNFSIENMPKSIEGNLKKIDVKPFGKHFIDCHGFVFKCEHNIISVFGKTEGLNETIQNLTEEDINFAKELQYPVCEA